MMKFFIYTILSFIFILNGIDNAAVIHPIHVQTIPFGSRLSSTANTPSSIPSSHQTFVTSTSTSLSSSTDEDDDNDHHHHHHGSSVWSNRSNCIQAIVGIVVLAIVLGFLIVAVKSLCLNKKTKSNKRQSTNQNHRFVFENRLYVSTISGKREEQPPAYAELHRI